MQKKNKKNKKFSLRHAAALTQSFWVFAVGPSNSYWPARKELKAIHLLGWLVDAEALSQQKETRGHPNNMSPFSNTCTDAAQKARRRQISIRRLARGSADAHVVSMARFVVSRIRGWPPHQPQHIHTNMCTTAQNDHTWAFNAQVEFTRGHTVPAQLLNTLRVSC